MNGTSCETPGTGDSPPLGGKYRSGAAVGVGGNPQDVVWDRVSPAIAGDRALERRNPLERPPTPDTSFLSTGGTFPLNIGRSDLLTGESDGSAHVDLSGGLFAVPDTKRAE